MAKNGTSNTVIVAIVVIAVVVIIGIAYYFFSERDDRGYGDNTRRVERRTNVIERPVRRHH